MKMAGNIIKMPPREPPPPGSAWLGLLARGDKHQILTTTANALILLGHDEHTSKLLAYDELFARGVITGPPPLAYDGVVPNPGPYPRPWDDTDLQLILAYVQRTYSGGFKASVMDPAIATMAASNRFHPIRDWLATLKWDGKKRLDRWVYQAFDVPVSPYAGMIGRKFLIAAVRRIRSPGCKFDHMPIFEGAQGIGKSTCLQLLFGAHWFADSLPNDLSGRDAAIALAGIWCVELAEIDQIIRAEVETVKAFLSRPVDRFIPRYGRVAIEVPRQSVLVGTTNNSDYLRDSTGNRRFWPLECRAADQEWVVRSREQLWAEAAVAEATGEGLWIEDPALRGQAEDVQASRMTEDTWQDVLADWLQSRMECTTADAMTHGINIPRERQDRRSTLRVVDCLRRLGWKQHVDGRGSTSRKVWRRIPTEQVYGS